MVQHTLYGSMILLSTRLVWLDAKENFNIVELAKARGEDYDETTTLRPTYNFAWKVTVTVNRPPTKSVTAGTKDHGIIMDALHRTMMDYEYRQMWMSLMKHSYSLFMEELKVKGPKVFIKPRHKKKDDTFEGEEGKRRWQFLIDYFSNMNYADFERILTLFDYDRHKNEHYEMKTYSSPPLPTGYWERTDPSFDWAALDKLKTLTPYAGTYNTLDWAEYNRLANDSNFDWRKYTVPDNGTIDPWKFTVNQANLDKMYQYNPRFFTTPDK